MDSGSAEEEVAVEEVPTEAVSQKGHRRSVAEGRLQVPPDWPKWKKQCGVVRRGRPPCRSWAVIGMPTCKFHGSGGEAHRKRGELRYLAWVVLGGPQNMPIEQACTTSLGMFAEYIFSEEHSNVKLDTRIKAAMWLIDMTK